MPPSFPPPVRPDLADRLLAAVAERDQPMADRLVQQWVHRRGLEALEALTAGPLLASQGPEAALWLQERSGAAPLEAAPLEPAPLTEAVPSRSWPQLAVVPAGEPAPTPRALAPLRAWLPDADDLIPLAS